MAAFPLSRVSSVGRGGVQVAEIRPSYIPARSLHLPPPDDSALSRTQLLKLALDDLEGTTTPPEHCLLRRLCRRQRLLPCPPLPGPPKFRYTYRMAMRLSGPYKVHSALSVSYLVSYSSPF